MLAYFADMAAFGERTGAIPAEVREHSWSCDAFGSWSVLRCGGRAVRVLWDGKEDELVVERAVSRTAPYEWQSVASWASKTGTVLGPEVIEAVEQAAG